MNLTALITLPARLGYEAARRTLDVASGIGQMVGLGGGDSAEPATEAPAAQKTEQRRPAPRRGGTAKPKPKPAAQRRASKPRRAAAEGAGPARKPAARKRAQPEPAATPAAKAAPPAVEPAAPVAPEAKPTPAAEAAPPAVEPASAPFPAAAGSSAAEPSPADIAASGEGRQPAPFGSHEPSQGGETPTPPSEEAPDPPAPARRFNAEEHSADAEPLPSELAERGEGRQPAPLGSSGEAPGGAPDRGSRIP